MRRSGLQALVLTLCLGVVPPSLAAEGLSMSQVIADLGLPAEAAEHILHGEMVQDDPEESSDRMSWPWASPSSYRSRPHRS